MADPKWPTKPDGTPMKMGEMTKAQQAAQIKASMARIKTELESEGIKAVMEG